MIIRVCRAAANCIDLDQCSSGVWAFTSTMQQERADDLARLCTDAVRKGNDFPTIWNTLLKIHPLVEGIPRQRLEGNRIFLDIRLITGERLVLKATAKGLVSGRMRSTVDCAYSGDRRS